LDAAARAFNPQSSGFTVTARVMASQSGYNQRLFGFGSGQSTNNIILSFAAESNQLHLTAAVPNSADPRRAQVVTRIHLPWNSRRTITPAHSSSSAGFKLCIDGVVRLSISAATLSNCCVGRSYSGLDAYFSGRMKFFAACDRALTDAEILSRHARHAPLFLDRNVTLTSMNQNASLIVSSDIAIDGCFAVQAGSCPSAGGQC
jgi:hypothetical protein